MPDANRDLTTFIALDVETSGNRIGIDSMLSLGACVVTREQMTYDEKFKKGLLYYVEMKPTSVDFIRKALAVGASKLGALNPVWNQPIFIPGHTACDEVALLRFLQDSEQTAFAPTAMRNFRYWLRDVTRLREEMGVIDTAFFDAGFFNYYCTQHGGFDPLFGHVGLDLRSYWSGKKNDPAAKMSSAKKQDDRPRKHHAGDDAYDLAETARVILYPKSYELVVNR